MKVIKRYIYVIEDLNKCVKIGISASHYRPASVCKRNENIDYSCRMDIFRLNNSNILETVTKHFFAGRRSITDHKEKTEWYNVTYEEVIDFIKNGLKFIEDNEFTAERWMNRYILDRRHKTNKKSQLWV
jgi:hypothetical protein